MKPCGAVMDLLSLIEFMQNTPLGTVTHAAITTPEKGEQFECEIEEVNGKKVANA